ncbi:MAG TPA: OmpA family protein [Cellvibrio sp.]|nr:OmpA family protein [Cellvibrio sp.]
MKTLPEIKKTLGDFKKIGMVALMSAVLAACASSPKVPQGAIDARNKLTQLQSDPQLASLAPVAIREADEAVRAAEKPTKDKPLSNHLILLADRKVDTASALAQARFLEDQRKGFSEQRALDQLSSRTQEAEAAKADANAARQQADNLQREIAELNAKATERGLVVTLGDLLFETGKADLKGGAAANLSKLSAFLTQHVNRGVIIEGHTDSVGSESFNMGLSQRRADSVKAYLLAQGVAADRVVAVGKGETTPVASNDSASGRQMNRRVEVIISNPVK